MGMTNGEEKGGGWGTKQLRSHICLHGGSLHITFAISPTHHLDACEPTPAGPQLPQPSALHRGHAADCQGRGDPGDRDPQTLNPKPHSILRSLVRQTRPELPYVACMRKGSCGVEYLAAAAGELWRRGVKVHWEAEELGPKAGSCEGELLLSVVLASLIFKRGGGGGGGVLQMMYCIWVSKYS